MRPGKRPYSLSWRLLGVTALVLILAGAGVVGAIAAVQNFMPELVLEHRLESNAKRVIDALQYDQQDRPYQVTLSERRQMLYQVLPKDSAYRLLDGEGRVLLASDGAVTAYTRAGRDFDPTARLLNLQPDGMKVAVLTLPFSHRGQPMFMQLMRSDRLHRFTLTDDAERVRDLTLIASLVGMLLFSLVVVATLHYLLKPLRRTSAAIASIQPENLSARLSLDLVPLELTPLFDGFNLALDRLETGYRQQRQFLADVAHELKTPLALMRGQVELGQLGDRSMLLKDIDQMARHVHQLLHLAEASEQHNYLVEALDPGEVLAQVCEQLERLARSREVRVVFIASDAAGPELVNADAGALSVLLKNLLENALHHSPPGSTVNVCADGAGISIRDHGPGIAPEAMPHLFERFWRGPHRRDEGAGLGLSICAEIVRAHGWALHVTSTDPGAQFDVRFNAP
jgi:signal transduction histidine kinase